MGDGISLLRKQMKERQITRVLSMQPGRELDAIVAEAICEFHVETQDIGDGSVDYWYKMQQSGRIGDKIELERVPNYSTVIYSTIPLIAKFPYWSIQNGEGGKGVDAAFSLKGEPETYVRNCSTLPEAICKAGLIAMIQANKLVEKLMV